MEASAGKRPRVEADRSDDGCMWLDRVRSHGPVDSGAAALLPSESLREAAPEAKEWFRREATRMLELGAWDGRISRPES